MSAFSRFLRCFIVVGKLGSTRKAAEQLDVSALTIDRRILRAEADRILLAEIENSFGELGFPASIGYAAGSEA